MKAAARIRLGLLGGIIGVAVTAWSPASANAATESITVVSSVATTALTPEQITEPGTYSFQFAAEVPDGGRLRPLDANVAEGGEFSDGVVVEDADGTVVGAYDEPYTVAQDGSFLPTTYRIDGTDLIQTVTVDEGDAVPATVIFSDYAPVGATTDVAPPSLLRAAAFVSVPAGYVYNPELGSLHDYCTSSPDSWASADFRGPCATHDMCYEVPGDHKAACDAAFKQDLYTNCNYAYGSLNPLRATCRSIAVVYYAAVTAFGDDD
nr:phospholipase A2 [Kineosporia mesophila]